MQGVLVMERITPQLVRECYEQTGLSPATCRLLSKGRACALGAIAVASGYLAKDDWHNCKAVNEAYQKLFDRFGMDYVLDFYSGFDGEMACFQSPGLCDGLATRIAILYEKPNKNTGS